MLNTNIIHRFIFFLITLTTFIHCYSMDNEVPIMPTKLYLEEIYPDFVTIKTSIDSSFQNSKNLYEQYINKQDTITASLCLLELADIERLRGRYEESRITSYNVCYTKLLRRHKEAVMVSCLLMYCSYRFFEF